MATWWYVAGWHARFCACFIAPASISAHHENIGNLQPLSFALHFISPIPHPSLVYNYNATRSWRVMQPIPFLCRMWRRGLPHNTILFTPFTRILPCYASELVELPPVSKAPRPLLKDNMFGLNGIRDTCLGILVPVRPPVRLSVRPSSLTAGRRRLCDVGPCRVSIESPAPWMSRWDDVTLRVLCD